MRKLLCALAAFALLGMPTATQASDWCTDSDDAALPITLQVEGTDATGHYALPSSSPQGLVVFAHGYGHTSKSWKHHLSMAARDLKVIAIAMDYRGTTIVGDPNAATPSSRGWRVAEGALDSIVAAKHFEAACAAELSGKLFVDFGVSMGGNTSGLIAAAGAKRSTGTPLFDYWINVEGATNVVETYHEASAVAPFNAFAAQAKADIEAEMGGTFAEKREVYLERAVVTRADDIAAAGIHSVVLVHGLDDGLVPYNQSREMAEALRAVGVGYEFYTVARRDAQSEQDTTITGTVIGPVKPDYVSPLAGHASEKSTTNIVMRQSFAALRGIYQGQPFLAKGCYRHFLVDDGVSREIAGDGICPH